MINWEYHTMKFEFGNWLVSGKFDEEQFNVSINSMGTRGWELINVFATAGGNGNTKFIIAVFKRQSQI